MSIEPVIIIFLAIALGSFAKGLTGIGLPLVGIPVVAGFLGVQHAVVVMTIPVFVSNVWIVWAYRERLREIPGLPMALGAAAAGVLVGTTILATLDERVLTYIVIGWLAAYLINLLLNPDFRLEGEAARRASPVLAALAGISQGATGMSGPVVATWIHAYRLGKEAYVFGVSVMFLGISVVHISAVSGAGLMDQTRLLQGLIAVIPTVIFVPIGMRLTRAISQRLFNRLIVGLVIVMECKLIWQVATSA
jgi:hypothetical protein